MEHELSPNYFILLDQGYIPGLLGVSHGALQFMAYEELKKGNSQYFFLVQRSTNWANKPTGSWSWWWF